MSAAALDWGNYYDFELGGQHYGIRTKCSFIASGSWHHTARPYPSTTAGDISSKPTNLQTQVTFTPTMI